MMLLAAAIATLLVTAFIGVIDGSDNAKLGILAIACFTLGFVVGVIAGRLRGPSHGRK